MNKALYVHVPFCQHICAYCDFMRCGYQTQLADQWLRSLRQELAQKGCWQAKTIYIGGGTPSALSLDQLRKLLHLLAPYANQVREYTIEANPDSFTKDKIALCRSFGVNRVSLGVQSFHDELLQYMDRPGNRMTTLSCAARNRDKANFCGFALWTTKTKYDIMGTGSVSSMCPADSPSFPICIEH